MLLVLIAGSILLYIVSLVLFGICFTIEVFQQIRFKKKLSGLEFFIQIAEVLLAYCAVMAGFYAGYFQILLVLISVFRDKLENMWWAG